MGNTKSLIVSECYWQLHEVNYFSSHYQLLIREGCGDVTALFPFTRGHGSYWSLSQTSLWVHPERVASSSKALTHGRGLQGYFDMQLISAPGEPEFKPATFQSLVDLLYPLSYSRPYLFNSQPLTPVM